ncbi:hypothetical protein BD410DRAFT_780522 [Rickenella mellea]|uniref:Uncharacterized protein n=1 Tax=Rickenella mellea TaxID=50990 RepID=A0A4R5XGT3_9AGAM|nr:hypothetical protein BD410DRAFT_780522 [Rickenella mellea]
MQFTVSLVLLVGIATFVVATPVADPLIAPISPTAIPTAAPSCPLDELGDDVVHPACF